MATTDPIGAHERTHITPAVHEARARLADFEARRLRDEYARRAFTGQFADGATPAELDALAAARMSHVRLAVAHRQAARRVARVRRVRRLLGWS